MKYCDGKFLKGIIELMKNISQIQIRTVLVFLFMFLISSCSGQSQIQIPDSVNTPVLTTATLKPSQTPFPTFTPIATARISSTPLPSPTSTPRSHEVKLGETLLGIAFQYNVSLDSIKKINPDVDPNSMKVGMKILIPAETVMPGNETPFPTAITLPITSLNCLTDSFKGVWCFGWIQNITQSIMESVKVNVNLADEKATSVFSQNAVIPLNALFPEEKLPFAVYFQPEIPDPFQTSAQFSSSIPLDADLNQYRRIELADFNFSISTPLVASVSGRYQLPENTSQIWIVAVVLNDSDEIIGLRRWESNGSESGEFKFSVYAVSGEIADVLVFAEAQP